MTYKEEKKVVTYARVIVPMSSDAPYGEQDARLWNRVAVVLGILVVGATIGYLLLR